METTAAKPKNYSFINNEFFCEHVSEAFSKFSKYSKRGQDSINLRSKEYNTVLDFFIWSIRYLKMLETFFIFQHYLQCLYLFPR